MTRTQGAPRFARAASSGIALVALLAGAGCTAVRVVELPDVVSNDNRVTAGSASLAGDTLRVNIVLRMARWRPEGDSGAFADVAAFAEEGKVPQIPAPLIRVREGTVIVASVRNGLSDSTIHVVGLGSRPFKTVDSLSIRPGRSGTRTFVAGALGTYLYGAFVGHHDPARDDERETTGGGFIVDPRGGSPPDRVLVLNIWGRTVNPTTYSNALAINGRSWPETERITATAGDTLRWRVINATIRPHPMHLHGFYFDVASRGDMQADTQYAPPARPRIVTEAMRPFGTMLMTTVAERPGNWLFHCHIGFHVIPGGARLDTDSAEAAHRTMAGTAADHMAGLVLGITVAARPGQRDEVRGRARSLSLFVDEAPPRHQAPRTMGYVLQRGPTAPAPDSVEAVGSTLFLTRGEPTNITVHNRLRDPTAVHWHGIELESYSDGVVGWSGSGTHVAPMIAPADSFVASLTLRRAGTFIYHTHLGDFEQLTSGLYGAIIVTEPGAPFDPAHDHVYVSGWDGPADPPFLLVNGTPHGPPLTIGSGRVHRFRFVGIGVAGGGVVSLRRGNRVVEWLSVAKDGAELAGPLRVTRTARQSLRAGETYDFEITPGPGEYALAFDAGNGRQGWHQRIRAVAPAGTRTP